MRHSRLLASILALTLAGLTIGTATAWLSDSETITYEISAASDFGDEPVEKVWVCKLVGPPDEPKVKEGDNPIHVSADSIEAEEAFSDTHPSYVVESGDVECEIPAPEESGSGDASTEGSNVDEAELDEPEGEQSTDPETDD